MFHLKKFTESLKGRNTVERYGKKNSMSINCSQRKPQAAVMKTIIVLIA